MTKEPMTQFGYAKLSKELEWYKNDERPKTVIELDYARSLGDLKENAEYHAAKERLAFIDAKVAELADILGRAQVIDPATLPHKKVSFGSTVTLLDVDADEELEYTIVGAPESNPENGFISIHSPLARVLMGKAEGDEVHANFGSKKMEFEILKVYFKPLEFK